MPTTVQVKVNTVQHISIPKKSDPSVNLNYVEVTGYDNTNRKGFKKRFFATKQDNTATVNAEIADTLVQDDWCEFVLDDTTYKNVQTIKKIGAPAGSDAPSQAGGGGGGGGRKSSGGGGGMTKEEWALKDLKKEISIHRQAALKNAVNSCADGKPVTKAKMQQIEKMALRMTAFLDSGDFDGPMLKAVEIPKPEAPVTREPGDEQGQDGPGQETTPVTQDDDIPF